MIRIDDEFKSLIPPLQPEERKQLEQNIIRDGCRDPLVVWNLPPSELESRFGYGLCKDCGSDKHPDDWVHPLGDGVWECPDCGYGIAPEEIVLVDGHNRFEICTRNDLCYETKEMDFDSRDEAKIWIIQNQFGRRNLQPFTRTNLALQLEPLIAAKAKENQSAGGGGGVAGCQKSDKVLELIDTKKEIAKVADVSHDTVAKVKIINKAVESGKVSPQVVAKLHSGEVSINRVARDVKEAMASEKRQIQRKEAAASVEPQFFDNVHVGDFRDHFDKVADGSLSLIFTDPPYDRKAIDLFDGLGEFASAKLADGGSLLAYVGHIQIPEAINALSKNLRYWWVCCCLHSGGESLMKEYGIRVGWKAMLWFVKGTRDDKQNIVRDVVSGGREKSHHDWQQSQSEAEYWIENLCPPDGIVCDPFLGGGTTAAAAISMKRKWVGFEIDHDQAVLAMQRCKQ